MSTAETNLINKIRSGYVQTEKPVSKLERLKQLNKTAKRPATVFAYIFGVVGTLIMGTGMCLVMPDVIAGMMTVGICVGLVGMLMIAVNYFIYKKMLKSGMKKYSKQILDLSDELLNANGN